MKIKKSDSRPVLPVPVPRGIAVSPARKPNQAMLRKLTDVLSGPPLMPNESESDYRWIQKQIYAAIEPENMIELIWTKDIADPALEVERMKRLRSAFILKQHNKYLASAIADVSVPDPFGLESKLQTAQKYVREQHALAGGETKVRKRLRDAGIDPGLGLGETIWEIRAVRYAHHACRDAVIRQLEDQRERARKSNARTSPRVIDLDAEDVT